MFHIYQCFIIRPHGKLIQSMSPNEPSSRSLNTTVLELYQNAPKSISCLIKILEYHPTYNKMNIRN